MSISNPYRITAAVVTARSGFIPQCLVSLRNQTLTRKDFEILVIAEYAPPLALEPGEIWVAYAPKSIPVKRNIALRRAKAPIIAFLDDDCVADPHWLEKGLAYVETHPGEIGAQGKIYVPIATEAENPNARETNRLTRPLYQTSNIFYRIDPLCAEGGFDERFSFQREDSDMGFTLIEKGFLIGYEPEAMVEHPPRRDEYWDLIKTAFRKRYDPLLKKKHPALFRKHFRIFPGSFKLILFLWLGVFLCSRLNPIALIVAAFLLLACGTALTLKKHNLRWMGAKWFFSSLLSYLAAPWVCIFSVAGGWGKFCWNMKKPNRFPLTRIGWQTRDRIPLEQNP